MKDFLKIGILTAMIAIAVMGCKKDKPETPENPESNMQSIELVGVVNDTNGNPLSGVKVTSGTASAVSNGNGEFHFSEAKVIDRRAIIKFERDGYFTLTRSREKESSMYFNAVLYPKGNSEISLHTTFDASEGATLKIGGMKAEIPSSSLSRADGSAYSGTVTADMLYLDPSNKDFANMMPGGDLAAICADGSETMLISYGMSDIILTDNAGNLLQITTGMAVKITYPVPAGMKDCLPPTIPLWEFDDATGTWRETTTTTTGGVTIAGEGATLQGEEYVGYITILEWGNLDYPSKRIDIEIRIVDTTKKPIQGAIIYIGPISQTVSVEYPPNTTKPGDPPKKVSPPTPDDKKPGQTAIPTGPDGKGRGRIPRNEECNPQIDYRIEIWVWVKINHVWGYHRYIYNPPTPPEPGEVLPIPDIEVGGGGTAMPDLTEVEVVPLNKTESFTMGCTIEDGDCTLVEYPAHSVTLSHYYMQTHLITQLYWESIMGSIPASNNDECLSCPVFVQWLDIVGTETENGQDMDVMTIGNQTFYENGFIYKLNKKTGKKYRLPTEAEWEYAARGGKYQGLNNKYSGSDHIDNVAWYNQNSDFRIHPVGEKHPNVLGIYDMSGNVWEWCYDYYLYNYYTEEPQTNPTGPETGWERVVRGGSYLDAARECRVSFRIGASASYTSSYVGVRLVRVE